MTGNVNLSGHHSALIGRQSGARQWVRVEDRLPPENSGFVLVTNNLTAKNAFGSMSHVWLSLMIHPQGDGTFDAFAHPSTSRVNCITHWTLIPDAVETSASGAVARGASD